MVYNTLLGHVLHLGPQCCPALRYTPMCRVGQEDMTDAFQQIIIYVGLIKAGLQLTCKALTVVLHNAATMLQKCFGYVWYED